MNDFLTFEETATALRMSVPGARWHRKQGDFPSTFRIGRRLFVRKSDLDAFMQRKYEEAGLD